MKTHIRTYFAIFLAMFLVTQTAGIALAAENGHQGLESIRVTPLVVSVVISFVIPLITGLITKLRTSTKTKGLITLVLTLVQTLIVQNTVEDGGAVFSEETLLAFALSFAIAVSTYYGAYKPLRLTSSPVTVADYESQRTRVVPGKLADVGVK